MKLIKTDIQSICILRLSAIGDVTHVLPVLASIKKSLPEVKITWIIGTLEYKLMKGLSDIDFIVFEKSKGREALKKLTSDIDGLNFDVLLQMQYSFRANRLAWRIKATNRVGFDWKRSREFHSYKLTHRIQAVNNQHVLDGFMEFLKPLNISEKIYQWDITYSSQDREFALNIIKSNQLNIIISPCSSAEYRNWPNEKYAKIIDYLVSEYKAHVILCGGPSDYEIKTSKIIQKLSKHSVSNITGKDTLKQLYCLMRAVDLVISPDSGPLHIANASGTPVIGLHAATTAKRSGAYKNQELAIDCFEKASELYLKKPASKIRWGGQIKHKDTMNIISVNQVIEKIDQVLDRENNT
ncbi:MAG: glycosyltransferase family 9 protein [Marinicellaceae bacterium]